MDNVGSIKSDVAMATGSRMESDGDDSSDVVGVGSELVDIDDTSVKNLK